MTKKNQPIKAVTSKVDEDISLAKYIETHKPHYGLVASFKYEASKTEKGLADRTEAEWELGFKKQSKKEYK